MNAQSTTNSDIALPEAPVVEEEHIILDNLERLWSRRKVIGAAVVAVVALWALVMFAWSREPRVFDVLGLASAKTGVPVEELNTGAATTVAVIGTVEALLEKQGGYLRNDRFPPGGFQDNIPSWEFGVVTELRDTVRSLRNDFSRAQSQSVEDPDLMVAEAQLFFDDNSWILPNTEGEYRKGIEKDFNEVLISRNALGQLHRILHKLELALTPVWSPIILNRSGFGIFSNHSLALTSYISRANSAITDLRLLLSE